MKPENQEMAELIRDAYSRVSFEKPSPVVRNSKRTYLLPLAAAASVAGLVLLQLPSSQTTAWAATPVETSGLDRAEISTVCADHAVGATQPGPKSEQVLRIENLPELDIVDYRGDQAMAVFDDASMSAICIVKEVNGFWVVQSLAVTIDPIADTGEGPAKNSGAVASGGGADFVSGESVGYVFGDLPSNATAVHFALKDGTKVIATVFEGKYAAWYPSGEMVDPQSLRFD